MIPDTQNAEENGSGLEKSSFMQKEATIIIASRAGRSGSCPHSRGRWRPSGRRRAPGRRWRGCRAAAPIPFAGAAG